MIKLTDTVMTIEVKQMMTEDLPKSQYGKAVMGNINMEIGLNQETIPDMMDIFETSSPEELNAIMTQLYTTHMMTTLAEPTDLVDMIGVVVEVPYAFYVGARANDILNNQQMY